MPDRAAGVARLPIARRRPAPQGAASREQRRVRLVGPEEERAVGECAASATDGRSAGGHIRSGWRARSISPAAGPPPGNAVPQAARKASASARRHSKQGPVAGGEGGRLVQEKQFGVAAGRHRRPLPPLEGQAADDPGRRRPAPAGQTPAVVVQAAAVAHPGAAGRVGDDVAERRYAVLQRHGGSGRSGAARSIQGRA